MARRNPETAIALSVARELGDKVICQRCEATIATFADKCSAALDDPCEGFLAIEAVRAPIAARAYGR
jgi:ribosomal protein L40E